MKSMLRNSTNKWNEYMNTERIEQLIADPSSATHEEILSMAIALKKLNELTPRSYIYVTDVAERPEDQKLSDYDIRKRYGEKLLETIPLYTLEDVLDHDDY